MKNPNHYVLLFLVLLLLSACTKDLGCPDAIDLGTYVPTEKALDFVPYKSLKSVVFEDSIGNRWTYQTAPSTFQYDRWQIPGPCPENYYETVNYIHHGGHWETSLENDSVPIKIYVAVLSLQDYETRKIYDELVVNLYEPDSGYHQSLNLPVDQRLLRNPEFERLKKATRKAETREFFGQTFFDVYHDLTPDMYPFKTYYTAEQGIVAFRDQSGKLWVLLP